ncbi:MAG: hypothetical protein J0M12_13070 [Deltaproteobacteria bacterium]|nr:hypothetical protein [Deltaproteobacteria bacterium]
MKSMLPRSCHLPRSFAMLMLLACTSQYVRADGDSITRPSTAAERTFIVATKQALKDALPGAPNGWAVEYESPLEAEETVTFLGKKESALEVRYSAEYKLVEGLAEREAARDRAISESADARSTMDKLTAQIQQKIRAAAAAREAGDRSAYEQAKSEMEKAQQEYDALMEGPANPVKIVNAAEYAMRRDTRITVKAVANSRSAGLSGPLQEVQVPRAALAVRRDYSDSERLSRAIVLFGPWTVERFGSGQTQSITASHPPSSSEAVTSIQSVAMEFEAERDRLTRLLESIQPTGLSKLLPPDGAKP